MKAHNNHVPSYPETTYLDPQGHIKRHVPRPDQPCPADFVQWLQFVEGLGSKPLPSSRGFVHMGFALKTDYGMYLVDSIRLPRVGFAHYWSIEPSHALVFDSFGKARKHITSKLLAEISVCEVRYSKQEQKYLMPVILHLGDGEL